MTAERTTSKRRPRRGAPRFQSALSHRNLDVFIRGLPPQALRHIAYTIRKHVAFSIGDPTTAKVRAISEECEVLQQAIDFDRVLGRLHILSEFERGPFGVPLSRFFPELQKVYDVAQRAFSAIPKSVTKAELWLEPIARDAAADADVEAAVYFASRGRFDLVDPAELRTAWHRAICRDIEQGQPVGPVPGDTVNRARAGTLSLTEAADILEFNGRLPRFFAFRDEEEDFIDATFLRGVEWLGVTGFDRWSKSVISDFSVALRDGFDHVRGGWHLFYWCRSALLLRSAEKASLESWGWALMNGPHERAKPWRIFWPGQSPRLRDYLPLAGIVPFVYHRIGPTGMDADVVASATALLSESQNRSGAWSLYADDPGPSLLATCIAIHGLASAKPRGWESIVSRAAEWLMTQQSDGGYWDVQGGPTVHLTVLALDSIALSAQSGAPITYESAGADAVRSTALEPTYDYSQEDWFLAKVPKTTDVGLREAKRAHRPTLGIVVATQIELTAALKRLRAPKLRRSVCRVAYKQDTFYIGRFGGFDAVLMLCSMGTHGATGSTLSVDSLIRNWKPKAVIMPGIAFGVDRTKHKPGDVLIAQQIIPYEVQRQGQDSIQYRNPIPPVSDVLLNRFKNTHTWNFRRPDQSVCAVHYGPLLSGDKLIDNQSFKQRLVESFPGAIGGEMEGTGLWGSANRNKTEWIVAKAVCDWADGHKADRYQELAAAASVSLCELVFQSSHALDGL